MNDQLELEVFRAGDYGAKGNWGADDLDALAGDYDPTTHEAPVTVDHAQRGPALGWVASLRRVGDRLVARLRGLNARLLEMIRQGAFKKRSVEIYPMFRTTGRPYLRAVSFLGAAVPEVKGLSDPLPATGAFNESEAPTEAHERFTEAFDVGRTLCEANPSEPSVLSDLSDKSDVSETSEENAPPIPARVQPTFEEVFARLREAGRWQPAWADRGIGAFYEALARQDEVEAVDGQTLNLAQWFADFLDGLAPIVTMEELANPRTAPNSQTSGGPNVSPASIELHRRVVAFRESHPQVSYAEALGRCARG